MKLPLLSSSTLLLANPGSSLAAGRQKEVPLRRTELGATGDAPAGGAAEEGQEVEETEDGSATVPEKPARATG